MSLVDDLAGKGIRLKSYSVGEHYTTCPWCSAQRKKKNDPCLGVRIFDDGHATFRCNHCDQSGGVAGDSRPDRDGRPRTPPPKAYVRPKPPERTGKPQAMYDYWKGRGISAEVVDELGIFVTEAYFPKIEARAPCMAIPYRVKGQVVNHKYRHYKQKEFAQDKDAEPTLLNVDNFAHDELIWTEGEPDLASWMQAGFRSVTTLPVGAPMRAKEQFDASDKRYQAMVQCEAFWQATERHYLAYDSDEAGNGFMEEIARRIGKERCWIVRYPDDCKDANEVLVKHGADRLRECRQQAQPYPISGLFKLEPGSLLRYLHEPKGRLFSTGYDNLDPLVQIVAGQFWTVTGIPGMGKSEFIDSLTVNLAVQDKWRFAMCSPENELHEHASKLAEKYIAKPFRRREGEMFHMDDFDLESAEGWINEHYSWIRQDNPDLELTSDFILEKARAAVLREGIRGLVIDPYNQINDKIPAGKRETDYIKDLLNKMKRFGQSRGVTIFFVAHPQKLQRDPKSDKAPVPGLYDIAGSAHFANITDVGLTVHRPTDRKPETSVFVTKCRHKWVGRRGVAHFRWDRDNGRYYPITQPTPEEME